MPRVETIKGLERGIKVLQILQSEQISSLQDLHLATSYSKPSLLRILNTLMGTGMVTRRLADGHYRLSALTDVVRRRDRYDRVAEAAAPVLIRLCKKVKWPSDLYVPAGDHLERRETSRPNSPFVLRSPVRPGGIGTRIGWLMTGSGTRVSRVVSGEGAGSNPAETAEIQASAGSACPRSQTLDKDSERGAPARLRHPRSQFHGRYL